jgi:glutathione S-transferase
MILIGQYDSPFVRRVGIALSLYELPFEHQPWSVFSEGDKVRELNPLMRVPTLVLNDGTVLLDSHMMLDYLDSLVPPERALFPRVEPARHRALRIATLATGLGEKSASLFYEKRMHDQVSETWAGRCRTQINAVIGVLEAERRARESDYWFGATIGHADIAVATVLRFVSEVHPDILNLENFPALAAHCQRLEALPVFKQISQPFVPPA